MAAARSMSPNCTGEPIPRKAAHGELSRAQASAGRKNPTAWQTQRSAERTLRELKHSVFTAYRQQPFVEGAVGERKRCHHHAGGPPKYSFGGGCGGKTK